MSVCAASRKRRSRGVYKLPRNACSRSIASNNALKLPSPKPRAPWPEAPRAAPTTRTCGPCPHVRLRRQPKTPIARRLQVAAQRLLALDRLEQRLETPIPEAARAVARGAAGGADHQDVRALPACPSAPPAENADRAASTSCRATPARARSPRT